MKKEQIDPENFNFYRDENGTVTAEPKVKSLKLDDIVYDQNYVRMYAYGQTKKTSARKTELFCQIQRIADYANGDWEPDWDDRNQSKFTLYRNRFDSSNDQFPKDLNTGFPVFKSRDLLFQAYADNKDIFDEFFSL